MPTQEDYTVTGGLGSEPEDELTVTGGLGDGEEGHSATPEVSTQFADWKIGEIIDGKYEVLEVLGQGAMGIVYKVRHREWNLELAVKMPLPRLIANQDLKARFIQEAQTWVELGFHPNIVQCWYVREFGGIPRVFVDYLNGGSLKDWMTHGRVQPGEWEKILDLVIQACDGLGYAHEHGVEVHRDVKPGNLLMTADGELRVTDFGIAKRAGSGEEPEVLTLSSEGRQQTITMTGTDLGTPEYSAPEQWGTAKDADARADIYALGGVLFELCCGRRPFDDRSHRDGPEVLISRHLFSPAPDPQTINRYIPPPLSRLILRCLAKDPAKRPQSMAELRCLLAGLSQEISGKPYRRQVPQTAELLPDALNNRAASLLDLGRKNEALGVWKNALQLDPYHPASVYHHALLAWHEAKISDAAVVRKLEKAKHSNLRAALLLGFVHLERAAADLAEEEFSALLQHPEFAEKGSVWGALGDARMAQEKYQEAEQSYSTALKFLPEDREILAKREMARKRTRFFEGNYPLSTGRKLSLPEKSTDSPQKNSPPGPLSYKKRGSPAHEEILLFPWRHCVWASCGHRNGVTALAMSPDGRYVVSGSKDKSLKLWELNTGKNIRDFYGHQSRIAAVAVSPDGRRLVSASWDRTLRVWDLQTGECLTILKGHQDRLTALALSPDGKSIVSGSWDCTMRIWDLKNGKCLRVLKGHQGGINTLAMTADGQRIVSGSEDGTRRVWDLASGKCLQNFKGKWYARFLDSFEAAILTLTPDGQHALSAGQDRVLRFWDLNTSELLWSSVRHEAPVTALAMLPDGETAVSGSEDCTVRLWNLPSGGDIRIFRGHRSTVTAVAVTPDGRRVISGSKDAELRLWDTDTEECLRTIEGFQGHQKTIDALVVLPDGNIALSGGRDSQIKVWDLAKRRILHSFTAHTRGVTALLPSSNGQFVLSAGSDKRIHLWDLNTTERQRSFTGHTHSVTSLAVVPDAPNVISGSADGTLRVWDVNSAECLRVLKGHQKTVTAVAMLSKRVAISGSEDGTMRVWDVNAEKCLKTCPVPADITTLTSVPGETSILAGHADGKIRLWDFGNSTLEQTWEACQMVQEYRGHTKAVTSLALTPNGRHFVSASRDGTLRLWELATGRCVRTFEPRHGSFSSLAISPDGRLALSGGEDGILRIWSLEPDAASYRCSVQVSRQRSHKELLDAQEYFEKLIHWAESAAKSGKFSAALRYLTQARSVPGYERAARCLALNARLSVKIPRKDCRGGWPLRTIRKPESPIRALVALPDGQHVIAGYHDAALRLWDVAKGVSLKSYAGHTDAVNAAALTPDGRFLVSGSSDCSMRLWDLRSGTCLRQYNGHHGAVSAVSVSPCGRFLLSVSEDATLRIWNPKSAECLHLFKSEKHRLLTAAFTPDSRFLLSGDHDGTIALRDLERGDVLQRFSGHKGAVPAMMFLPDGRNFLSGGWDGALRLWSLTRSKCLSAFGSRHERITALALTSDGRFAISASADKALRLWNLKQKKPVWTFEGHEGEIEAVAITPNARYVISGGRDATLRCWELDWELDG